MSFVIALLLSYLSEGGYSDVYPTLPLVCLVDELAQCAVLGTINRFDKLQVRVLGADTDANGRTSVKTFEKFVTMLVQGNVWSLHTIDKF